VRPDLDAYLLTLARVASGRTTCIRRGVGCVLADAKGRVLAIAYNGVAAGMPHCNESTGFNFVYGKGIDKKKPLTGQSTATIQVFGNACVGHDLPPGQDRCEAVHAEQNALVQCARPDDIHTAYVTLAPCLACTKLLLGTGCQRICFAEDHTGATGKELWTKARRQWSKRPAGSLDGPLPRPG
jgi:dCMP deaminase